MCLLLKREISRKVYKNSLILIIFSTASNCSSLHCQLAYRHFFAHCSIYVFLKGRGEKCLLCGLFSIYIVCDSINSLIQKNKYFPY